MSGAADQAAIDDLVGNAHGNLARVREILSRQPQLVNALSTWEETPIQAASQMANRPIIELLLELGAPLDCFTAAALDRPDDVREMLAAEPAVAAGTGVHGLPALYFAAVGNSVEAAELMVRAGGDVNAGAGGNTPLHGAAMLGRLEMTAWLLEHGADPRLPDYEHKTALERALAGGHKEVADLLRSRS